MAQPALQSGSFASLRNETSSAASDSADRFTISSVPVAGAGGSLPSVAQDLGNNVVAFPNNRADVGVFPVQIARGQQFVFDPNRPGVVLNDNKPIDQANAPAGHIRDTDLEGAGADDLAGRVLAAQVNGSSETADDQERARIYLKKKEAQPVVNPEEDESEEDSAGLLVPASAAATTAVVVRHSMHLRLLNLLRRAFRRTSPEERRARRQAEEEARKRQASEDAKKSGKPVDEDPAGRKPVAEGETRPVNSEASAERPARVERISAGAGGDAAETAAMRATAADLTGAVEKVGGILTRVAESRALKLGVGGLLAIGVGFVAGPAIAAAAVVGLGVAAGAIAFGVQYNRTGNAAQALQKTLDWAPGVMRRAGNFLLPPAARDAFAKGDFIGGIDNIWHASAIAHDVVDVVSHPLESAEALADGVTTVVKAGRVGFAVLADAKMRDPAAQAIGDYMVGEDTQGRKRLIAALVQDKDLQARVSDINGHPFGVLPTPEPAAPAPDPTQDNAPNTVPPVIASAGSGHRNYRGAMIAANTAPGPQPGRRPATAADADWHA